MKSNNNRLSLLFGNQVSKGFLDNSEISVDQPESLHYIFRKAHKSVLDVIEYMKIECDSTERKDLSQEAKNRLNILGFFNDKFSTQVRIVLRQNRD
ncbi:MAG: hypothetical protein ACI9LO_002070 [Planctomycetota bacterium]